MKTSAKIDTKKAKPAYGKPVPTKFESSDMEFLRTASNDTNLPVSVIVRKAVKLLKLQKQNFRSYGFIIDIAA